MNTGVSRLAGHPSKTRQRADDRQRTRHLLHGCRASGTGVGWTWSAPVSYPSVAYWQHPWPTSGHRLSVRTGPTPCHSDASIAGDPSASLPGRYMHQTIHPTPGAPRPTIHYRSRFRRKHARRASAPPPSMIQKHQGWAVRGRRCRTPLRRLPNALRRSSARPSSSGGWRE